MSTDTVTTAVPAGTWNLDPLHSSIRFAVVHSGVAPFRSGFESYEATLTGGEAPALEGSVEVSSIEIPDEQFKGHLMSPEFFDAENHPKLSFRSSSLEIAEDGAVRVRGELEIRGETREVEAAGRFGTVPAYLDGKERVGFSLETTVDRNDFGVSWNADLPQGGRALEDEVTINVELQFVAEGE